MYYCSFVGVRNGVDLACRYADALRNVMLLYIFNIINSGTVANFTYVSSGSSRLPQEMRNDNHILTEQYLVRLVDIFRMYLMARDPSQQCMALGV